MPRDEVLTKSKSPFIKPAIILAVLGIAVVAIFYFSNFNVVARVNGKAISKSDYEKRINAEEKYEKDYQKISFSGNDGEKKLKDLKKRILDQMIEEEVIQEEAGKLNIKVNEADINKEFDSIVKTNGGESKFEDTISKYYGYTKDDYKRLIIKPKIFKQKLQDNILASEEVNKSAKTKAEDILKQLKGGANFADLAKKYSEDNVSAGNGGDLGFVEKGKMVKEWEDQAFKLNPGEISNVFKTVYGYHILKVEEKKDNKVHIRQILVKTESFSEWLENKIKSTAIKTYVKF